LKIEIIPISFGFVKAFLVKGDKTIIVDAGLKGSTKKILRAMQANGIKPSDVSLLLVTHVHGDHMGGLKALKDMLGAPVAVHQCEAEYLAGGKSAPVVLHSSVMKLLSGIMKRQKLQGVQPDVLIGDRLILDDYGVEGFVFPTPGHTDGSVTLVTGTGDAIVGDMVGGGRSPAFPGVYKDLQMLKASIGLLKWINIRNVYTSHGGVYPIDEVLKLGK